MSVVNEYAQAEPSILKNPEQLLKEYLPLIRYHADQLMRRTPNSIELDDLIDTGVLGLLDAASRFESDREVQFKTFVSYRIRGAMIDYLRTFDWMPRGLRDSSKALQQAMLAVEQQKGRPAEESEIASYLQMSLSDYRHRLDQVRTMSVVHFDDLPSIMGDEDEMNMLDTLEGDTDLMPERQYEISQFVERLAAAIDGLPTREGILLTLYYYEELTMKEVAMILGLTESRVSQIHSQMVVRLRAALKLD